MENQVSESLIKELFPFLNESPAGLVSEIRTAGKLKRFSAGHLVYAEGDSCAGIAFLISGEIRVFKTGDTGRELTLYEIAAGETCILNASCILSGSPYPANAIASDSGEMLFLNASDFRRLVANYEQMRDFVFRILSMRLSGVMALVEEVAFGRMDERVLQYVLKRASDGELRTTHARISEDLGSSREVVSRILKHLETKGVVSLGRNLIRIQRI